MEYPIVCNGKDTVCTRRECTVCQNTKTIASLFDTDVNKLIGMLLTLIDATFVDSAQRNAQKSLVKQKVWEWYAGVIASQYEQDKAPVVLVTAEEETAPVIS